MTPGARSTSCIACSLIAASCLAAQHHVYTVHGERARELLGWSVAAIGHVDKDGAPDFAVGAPGELGIGMSPGVVRIVSGRDGRTIQTLRGDAIDDQFGVAIAGAGDVDLDGWPDIVVGAWGHDRNGKSSGQVKVHSGRDGRPLHVIHGDGTDDHFGCSVAAVGDVDRDGHADFVAGALWDDDNGPDSGSISVFSGKTGALLFKRSGDLPGDYLGWRVGGLGDVDGDGHDDVVAGAPLHARNGPAAGLVRVYSGRTGNTIHSLHGDAALDQLGMAVGICGDVDRDGHADVIGGAPGADQGGDSAGLARVWSGRTGGVLLTFAGQGVGDLLGTAVAGAGDVDRDGHADLIAGAPGALRLGKRAGEARVWSGRSGQLLLTVLGEAAEDHLGAAVASGGDLNGDGFAEVLVGARQADVAATNAGLARALSVEPLALTSDVHEVLLAPPGTQRLELRAGALHGSKVFALLGSVSGTQPGFVLGAVRVPLNLDAYTLLVLAAPGALLVPTFGWLDSAGQATAGFVMPSGLPPALAGVRLDHAYVVLGAGAEMASNAVPVRLVR